MELPDFSSLWEASSTLEKLEQSLRLDTSRNSRGARQKNRQRPIDTYYSDGICGVSFGIVNPEFSNPLKTCCDQHFFTEEEYDRHRAEHVPCTEAGCSLVLHPSILKFHIETVHAKEDLYARLRPALEGDKSLTHWIESRRKNYPTFERVQAKIREVGYRIDRGQVLVTRQFGSLNARKPQELRPPVGQGNKQRRRRKSSSPETVASKRPDEAHTPQSPPPSVQHGDLPATTAASDEVALVVEQTPCPRGDSEAAEEKADGLESAAEPPPVGNLVQSPVEPPKVSLLSRLQSVQPKNTSLGDESVQPKPSNKPNLNEQDRKNRIPKKRRQRRANGKRKHSRQNVDSDKEGGLGDLLGDEAESKSGAGVFASHPVVQMYSKRRACMRNYETINKRPTLLQM
ncbi:unnamed protein product, partial [Mesocestoides corti]